ncbi:RCC1/BLIP-II protein [Schizopora paradoxa]|uniref:RCC1/BLIP-II protein n=1 Tax=Schizopora paradoxa TaxID=27342 RepID=A0A0H2SRQ5_9AGAM|nr:RCC1/BLIP-II protein [Schizopora paradoxa]
MAADTTTRRSSRSKPTSTAANGKPPASKSKPLAPVNGKRPAAEEPEKPRSKRAKNGPAEPATKPAAKAPAKKATTPKPAAPPRVRVPKVAINALPDLKAHTVEGNPNQMFVWGAGNFGQFGMGPDLLDEYSKPKKNALVEKKIEEGAFGEDDTGIAAIAAGGLHTLFIDGNGTVWSCGVNDEGALGRPTTNVPDPEKEGEFLDTDNLTAVPHPLQSLVDEKFKAAAIAAGDSISAAISVEGELRVWGSFRAAEGALGFSGGSKNQLTPAAILTLPPKEGEKVASVSAGNNHLVVLTTFGHIYTWGAGEQGQLGRKIMDRHKIHGTNPEKVTLKSRNRKATVVGAGAYSSFAVDDKGDVWAWGLNNMGQTGTGYEGETETMVLQPTKVAELSEEELGGETIVQIAGGEHHTIFRTSGGRVFACGRANGGQLGLPSDHEAFKEPENEGMVDTPTLIPFPDSDDPIVHISAGIHNNLAVSASGALYSWGQGNQGELGVGDETDMPTPHMIVRREGGQWKTITAECGGQHSMALLRKKVPS